MAFVALFMVIWGARLVGTTWHQSIAEFPALSVGVTYLPIPIGGAMTLLFVLERLLIGLAAASRRKALGDTAAGLIGGAADGNPNRRRDPALLLCARRADRLCARLAALAGAYWIGIPLEAVMLQISSGVSKFAMLTIPFFVLAGAIMAEGGMARRLVAFANVLVGSSASAAGSRWSTCWPRRFSAAFPARRSPTLRRSAR